MPRKTHQAHLHEEATSLVQRVEATRNSATVGLGTNTAGLTVRDNMLRTVQCQLTVPMIDYLMEQLPIARAHLIAHAELDDQLVQL